MVPGMKQLAMVTKEAVTHYEVVERFRGFTMVRLSPKTGRTHQLRVHMSFLGYPMMGDTTYGGHFFSEQDLTNEGETKPLLDHQALHAWRIKFVHPMSEESVELEAPISSRIQNVIDLLRQHRKK